MDSSKEKDFPFPQCWGDDVRMDSLFAPFKPRTINPNNYDSKMKFWDSLIEQWCLHNKTPMVDLNVLCNFFSRKQKMPSCLAEVLNHLQGSKTLISREVYNQMLEQSWTKWAVQVLIANPLRWTLNTVKSTIIRSSACSDSSLLHLPVMKKLAQDVKLSVSENQKGKLMDINELKELSGMTNECLEVLLQYLCSQKLVAIYDHCSTMLVKFSKKENSNPVITDVDKALFSLEQNKRLLENNIIRLEERRSHFVDEARKHVAAKKMNMAATSLKRSKIVEKVIKKITDAVENIQGLIYQIEMTEMDSVIMDCYQTGIATLKNFFKESGLTKEKVESTRNELKEILIFKTDIDDAISESFDSQITDVTNEELEEELKNLLREEEPSSKKKPEIVEEDSISAKLPEVPTTGPEDSPPRDLEKKLASLSLSS